MRTRVQLPGVEETNPASANLSMPLRQHTKDEMFTTVGGGSSQRFCTLAPRDAAKLETTVQHVMEHALEKTRLALTINQN
ncbi:hypothetical protein CHS0354_038246 [Potamilus streckersoni]|uniref:Uncharacterized protein n=1 Tax=Potamilus streckersoni TaxID=2493646 RepID=A0AAE0W4F2_9BIVA|nr:hypothetical protein CHS0354_038246 [Potamilus streckersoni]